MAKIPVYFVNVAKPQAKPLQIKNKLLDQQDSIILAYKVWEKAKQSRHELKLEVFDLATNVHTILFEYKTISDSLFYLEFNTGNFDSLWNDRNQKSSKNSNELMYKYKSMYKTQAIVLKEKLLTYFPNYKGKKYWTDYEHPTNPLGIESIVDELEYLAKKL